MLRGRKILLTADDFSIRSGHADGASSGKTVYVEKLAIALRIPVVKLVDGSSGGGSVTTIKKEGWSYLPHVAPFKPVIQQLNMGIPNLGAVVGPAVCHTDEG
jgi:acetyl-CoA carboxylase carboxyltransferase component